jgi:hypothetical protein
MVLNRHEKFTKTANSRFGTETQNLISFTNMFDSTNLEISSDVYFLFFPASSSSVLFSSLNSSSFFVFRSKSLFHLGIVIEKLAKRTSEKIFIPYRDSNVRFCSLG